MYFPKFSSEAIGHSGTKFSRQYVYVWRGEYLIEAWKKVTTGSQPEWYTVFLVEMKAIINKINYLYAVTNLLAQKFHAYSKTCLKKFHIISEVHEFLDWTFAGNDNTKF